MNEVREILQEVKLGSIATCDLGKPWAANVFFAFDAEFNVYFTSRWSRRHSQNIIKTKRAAFAVGNQKFNFGEKVTGVQMEGTCNALDGKDAQKAFDVYSKRFPHAKRILQVELFTKKASDYQEGEVINRIWKLSPTLIKVFDENKYESIGKEYKI